MAKQKNDYKGVVSTTCPFQNRPLEKSRLREAGIRKNHRIIQQTAENGLNDCNDCKD